MRANGFDYFFYFVCFGCTICYFSGKTRGDYENSIDGSDRTDSCRSTNGKGIKPTAFALCEEESPNGNSGEWQKGSGGRSARLRRSAAGSHSDRNGIRKRHHFSSPPYRGDHAAGSRLPKRLPA